MKNFQNKVVVITGAGSGMGRAYATEFAKLGAKLALNDYNADSLADTVKLLGDTPVYSAAFDVSDEAAMNDFAKQSAETLGNAHVVINNAGIEGTTRPAWAISNAELEHIMGINFYGVVNGTRAFMQQLRANQEGAIVNISSVFGLIGTPNSSDYCASKFAVRGYTEALMVELQDSPIDAFLVHPGGIATNITQKDTSQDFNARYLTTSPEEIVKHVITSITKKRFRVVYGNNGRRIRLSQLLPLGLRNAILWREMKSITDLSEYPNS